MAIVFADLVQETTATTGTATLALAGAVAQRQTFVAGIGSGNSCYYTLLSGNGTDWEVGIGPVTSGSPDTLARTTILKSSNSNAAISLSGTSTVICSMPAEYMVNAQFSRYVAKTTTYTAVAGDQILADTSGGAWTLTLPASPAINDTIEVVDALQCFSARNLTISPNSLKIQGVSNNNLVLAEDCANAILTYTGTTYGWVVSLSKGASSATTWDVNNSSPNVTTALIPLAPNGRRLYGTGVAGSTSQNSSIKSTTSRSAGKLYFEVKLEGVATNLCIVGIAAASTATTGYPGADSVSWGIVAGGGAVYNNAGVLGTASPVPISGNTLGVAVDFTASTGSIKFYAANSLGYTVSSLTLGASYIMAGYSCAATAQKVLLCTTAQQCAYTPPSGYSYWDS